MKKITPNTVVLAIILGLCAFSTTNAQRWLQSDGSVLTNPNGGADLSAEGPVFKYYSDQESADAAGFPLGSVTIVNAGANGEIDSPSNSLLGGDDYGLISLLLTGNGLGRASFARFRVARFEKTCLRRGLGFKAPFVATAIGIFEAFSIPS